MVKTGANQGQEQALTFKREISVKNSQTVSSHEEISLSFPIFLLIFYLTGFATYHSYFSCLERFDLK